MNEGICSPFDNTTPVMEKSAHASLDPLPHARLPLIQGTSHSPAESTTGPTTATSVTNSRDSKPRQLRQTAGNIRCSDEHLQTENKESVLKELIVSAPRAPEGEWSSVPIEQQPAFPIVGINEMGALQHLSVSLKTTGETGLAISRPSHRLGVHAKPSEQSDEAVLHREFPKGNTLKGVRPSRQVMSAPASLSRMNVGAAVKLTAQERREVSTMKGKNATKHSPSPKTALTLPKSTPLSAIWALTLFPSSWTIVTLRMPIEVRKCRRMNRMTHQASEARTRVSLKAATPQPGEIPFMESIEHSNECSDTAIGPAVERALTSSSAEVEERRRVVDRTIRNIEKEDAYPASHSAAFTSPAPASVSPLIPHTCAANPCFGKMPHMACLERSNECSAIVEGPAVKLALAYSSSEVGERLWAAVYIQYEAEESIYAPTCSAAATLPVSVPAAPSVQSTHLQPSDGLTSHTEAMTKRCDLNVASKTPETHLIRSRNLEAARRQSNPSSTLARVDGGGPLAKADTHIQEHSRRCSPAFDEFVHWDPKIPPNKTVYQQSFCKVVSDLSKQKGLDTHISLLTAISTTITPASPSSLLSSMALMPSAPLPAFLSQIPHASQPSFKLGGLLVKSPCKGDYEWQPIKVANSLDVSGVRTRSPKTKTSRPQLVSRPGDVWTSVLCFVNIKLGWRVPKLPGWTVL